MAHQHQHSAHCSHGAPAIETQAQLRQAYLAQQAQAAQYAEQSAVFGSGLSVPEAKYQQAYLAQAATTRQQGPDQYAQQMQQQQYSQQYQPQAGPQRTTPLYPGLLTKAPRARCQTPLPPPPRPQLRATGSSRFSQSASFPSVQRQQQQQESNFNSSVNSHRVDLYYHSSFSPIPQPCYDPALPSPMVIVHGARKCGFNKREQERKHRGTSRNVLGGFYTS